MSAEARRIANADFYEFNSSTTPLIFLLIFSL
jgi:hypothetical protein